MRKKYFTIAVTLSLVLAFAESPASAAATVNPCSLVTPVQASAALGERAMPPQILHDASQSGCRWLNKSQSRNLFVTIEASNIFALVQKSGPWKVVHGVGDAALWSAGWIYVRKHKTYLGIELDRSPQSTNSIDPRLLTLARAIVARLP